MLTFKNSTYIFIISLAVLAGVDYFVDFPRMLYVIPPLFYVSAIFYGSYYIGSNFHIPVVCNASSNKNEVALTFDDGPVESNTSRILDVLKQNNVHAAFFCIGNRIKKNELLVKRIAEEGHLIGNHSYSHHFFFDLFSPDAMKKELTDTNNTAEKIISKKINLFRPPYGVTTPVLAKAIVQTGLIPVGWSLRSMDTVIKNEEKLISKIKNNLKAGDVILLHDTSSVTVNALQAIINEIKAAGFKLVRLDQLLNIEAYA